MEKIGTTFRRAVDACAAADHIPVVRFGTNDRTIDMLRRHLAAQEATDRSGVAAIGVAQEYQNVFAATQRQASNGIPWFSFTKADRRVTCFYFSLWDADFGAAFIKGMCVLSVSGEGVDSPGTSGPNAKPPGPGSGSPRCPTGSPGVSSRNGCRRSATSSGPVRSACSS